MPNAAEVPPIIPTPPEGLLLPIVGQELSPTPPQSLNAKSGTVKVAAALADRLTSAPIVAIDSRLTILIASFSSSRIYGSERPLPTRTLIRSACCDVLALTEGRTLVRPACAGNERRRPGNCVLEVAMPEGSAGWSPSRKAAAPR